MGAAVRRDEQAYMVKVLILGLNSLEPAAVLLKPLILSTQECVVINKTLFNLNVL